MFATIWPKLLVLVISILLFVATDRYFPIDATNPLARKQVRFWAIMLFIFSLVLGYPIEGIFEAQAKLERLSIDLKTHHDASMSFGGFQEMYVSYTENFKDSQDITKEWAKGMVSFVRRHFSEGEIPIPREEAPAEIGKVYARAKYHIVATNVGSTKLYFHDPDYVQNNIVARDRFIPVIRFYLYGNAYRDRIELRDGRHPRDINEFFREVKELHRALGTVYSAVIDVGAVNVGDHLDLLIMDNRFVAQTKLSSDWQAIRALATEREMKVKEFRQYVRRLQGAVNPTYVVKMADADVKKYAQNPSLPSTSVVSADAMFKYVMRSVAPID